MDAMTDTEVTEATDAVLPEFTIAMRGYDRLQVDEYIARLSRWMDEARARTEAAERAVVELRQGNAALHGRVTELERDSGTPSAAFEELGARIDTMLSQA